MSLSCSINANSRQDGFSLIEVMVAMLIVGVALPALMYQLGTQMDSAQRLKDQTIAGWVAQDRLALMRIEAASGHLLRPGVYNGVAEQAGRDWQWQLQVATTAVPGLYLYDIQVAAAENPSEKACTRAFQSTELHVVFRRFGDSG